MEYKEEHKMTNFWVWIYYTNESNQQSEFLDRISAKNKYQAESLALDTYRWAQSAKAVN